MKDGTDPRSRSLVLAFCLALVVLGANWAVFHEFGSDMPDWDQWDAEARTLLVPWFERDNFLSHLFEPHNEHRVVLTKVQNLATTLLAGQWDARVECFFNAFLHAGIALGIWTLARRWFRAGLQVAAFALLAGLYALPLAWQNVIGGFHSQQYWLIGLSFASVGLLPFQPAWSGKWWLGVLAAILVLGSMASGFLASTVVLAILITRVMARQTTLRQTWPTIALACAITAVGFFSRVERDYHAHMKAATAQDFLLSLARSFEWPQRGNEWAGLVVWAPVFVVAATLMRGIRAGAQKSSAGDERRWMIVALGLWVIVQLLATAYARGAGAGYPAPRYMDTLIFGVAVNALALGLLATHTPPDAGRSRRAALLLLATCWFVVVGNGAYVYARGSLRVDLPIAADYYRRAEPHVRSYLTSGDQRDLIDPIPYPAADALAERLQPEAVRRVLPESIRPALRVAVATSGSFNAGLTNARGEVIGVETVPADVAPLVGRLVFTSLRHESEAAGTEFATQPIAPPTHAWLRFDVIGQIPSASAELELRYAGNGELLSSVRIPALPSLTWTPVYVRSPKVPFVIAARERDSSGWFAFTAPTEVGSWPYWTRKLMARGTGLAVAGIATAAVVFATGRRQAGGMRG